MRGDNVVPSKVLAWRMGLVDAFRKTKVGSCWIEGGGGELLGNRFGFVEGCD